MSALGSLLDKARRLPAIAFDAAPGAGIFATGVMSLVLPGSSVPLASQRPAALGIVALEASAVTHRRKSLGTAYAIHVLGSACGLFTAVEVRGWGISQYVLLYTISEQCGWEYSFSRWSPPFQWTSRPFVLSGAFL